VAVNSITPVSFARQARAAVLVNGTRQVDGNGRDVVIDARVDQNTHYQADTFTVTLPLSVQHLTPSIDAPVDIAQSGPDYWSSLTDAEVQIFMGYPDRAGSWEPLELYRCIVGAVDDVSIDFAANRVHLVGRDLTARLIDTKTVDQYVNLTASQIVELIAAQHGLTPVVTPTETIAGGYYQQDHVSLQDSRPQWDLLTYLAEREGFQVYVTGRELHFEPRVEAVTGEPYVIQWQTPEPGRAYPISNAISLQCRRNLTMSRTVEVQVRSFNTKQRRGFTVTARRARIRNRVTSAEQKLPEPAQVYTYRIPNLTEQQAQERANRIANELSRHEMLLGAQLPGDHLLTARTPIRLIGTGSAFDQTYLPSTIVRTFDLDGYRMDVQAKNHSPESTVLP